MRSNTNATLKIEPGLAVLQWPYYDEPHASPTNEEVVKLAPIPLSVILRDHDQLLRPIVSMGDVEVSEIAFRELGEDKPSIPGTLILGVGVRSSGELVQLLRVMTGAAVAAVLTREIDHSPGLMAALEELGVTWWIVDGAVDWGDLFLSLRSRLLTYSRDEDSDLVRDFSDDFELANAIAARVHRPVVLEDAQMRVIAYSTPGGDVDDLRRAAILGREPPKSWREQFQKDGTYRKLWMSGGPVRFEANPNLMPPANYSRLGVAIRAGDEILGSVWAAETDGPLTEGEVRDLVEAASFAATHLVRTHFSSEIVRRMRTEQLRSCLETGTILDADNFGWTGSGAVVVFGHTGSDSNEAIVKNRRLQRLVDLQASRWSNGGYTAMIGGYVYALINGPGRERRDLDRMIKPIVIEARANLRETVRAGVGMFVQNSEQLRLSRVQADQVFRLLCIEPDREWATIADVRAKAILSDVYNFLEPHPLLESGGLAALRQHDLAHRTDYVRTLYAFISAQGNVLTAARANDVPASTFRYRLQQALSIANLELTDPDERLVLELEIKTLRNRTDD